MKAALLWALVSLSPAAACVLTGTVVDADSGKPLAGTSVYANAYGVHGGAAILTIAGEQGDFCFQRLEPGQYVIIAARTGYVSAVAGPLLKVESQTPLPALPIRLSGAAAIAGVVLGADGEPRERAYIGLYRRGWDHGWNPYEVANAETDDRGAFRFGQLAPGTYYLAARPSSGNEIQYLDEKGLPIRTAETLTYYGGAFSFSQATPIRLEGGQQLTNLVLTIEQVPHRRFSGRLRPSMHVEGGLRIQLSTGGAPDRQIAIGSDGTFSADGLLAAKYDVSLAGSANTLPVDLTHGDVDGFVFEPVPAIKIKITVRGVEPGVRLLAWDMESGATHQADPEPDGTLVLVAPPALYRLESQTATDHAFVKALLVDGEPQPGLLLDLRNGPPGTVQAILSTNVAAIEGKLETPGALPVRVVAMDEAKSRVEVISDIQLVHQTGKFKLESLAPGKYRLFAIEGFDPNLWGSLELAAALGDKSLEVELGERETRAVTLPVITGEEWRAGLKKVGL